MKKNRFYRWLPLEWRVPIIIISISTLSLIVFFLYASNGTEFSSSGIKLLTSSWIILSTSQVLIQRAVRPQAGTNGTWAFNTFVALFLVATVLFGPVEEALSDRKNDAETKWVISSICSENGKIKQDLLRECAAFKGQVCALGATPMYSCEVRLRNTLKLDLPDDQS